MNDIELSRISGNILTYKYRNKYKPILNKIKRNFLGHPYLLCIKINKQNGFRGLVCNISQYSFKGH